MSVSADEVKKLREMSGAPMMECKKALDEAGGDLDQAFTVLRKRGQAAAARKAGRMASEGLVGTYVHPGAKIAVMVELNCESDFVARNPEFQQLAHDLAMHVCATDPRFIRKEDVAPEILEREKAILREQAATSGKPAAVIEKMVEGRLEKFYEENCLYEPQRPASRQRLSRKWWREGWRSFTRKIVSTNSTSSRTRLLHRRSQN